ncbi:MAG: SCP2 sterol-binding domain-containing protein [Oscillospiraceae bacterium]|nr:SCP2 sterol-binding domain-containing protein [Oscillospiraceae bacterium]
MTFKEIMATVQEKAKEIDASKTNFLAVQVNLTGENGGVFYVEIKDGKVSAEPYEYNDRSCAITMSPENFMKFLGGKLDPVLAFTTGKLKVDGDVGKALEFSNLVK